MRLIDADALIDKTDDRYSLHEIGRRERDDIVDALEYAPTIQPEPQLEEWVLVSSDGYVMQDCIVERGGGKIWYHGGNIQADDRYMPLPEPYKGVTE